MTGTPPEDLLEWLLREEEALGTTKTERALAEYESARELLYEQLGFDPSESQVEGLMAAAQIKYEILPELGISMISIERPSGIQYSYYNYATHRFAATKDVMAAVRAVAPPIPFRPR